MYTFGWIKPADRTKEQENAHDLAMATMMPRFAISGSRDEEPGPFVSLLEFWKHPNVIAALGYEFPGVHQVTGSCVGAGGGNVLFSTIAVEIIKNGDSEEIAIPFWLYPYGKSRELLGETSEGDGSLGSTFAQAVKQFGIVDQRESDLPKPEKRDGLVWGESVERKWSNGRAIAGKWNDLAKSHLIKSTAEMKSSSDIRSAIRSFYGVTFACNNFVEPRNVRKRGSKEPVNVGRIDTNGGHQTSFQAVWDHPELGVIFWHQNQWGNAYETDPKMNRQDGCWIEAAEVDRAMKSLDAEVYAFSQFDGFPAQTINWASIMPRG